MPPTISPAAKPNSVPANEFACFAPEMVSLSHSAGCGCVFPGGRSPMFVFLSSEGVYGYIMVGHAAVG